MNKKIRIAVIGFGVVGRKRYSLLKEDGRFQVVALCDPAGFGDFEDRGILLTSHYEEVFKHSPHAVVVSTPNNFSSGIVADSLRRGIHVFCEKPPGRNVEEIEAVVREEEKNRALKLKYGFNHRYHEAIKEAKSIIESERLGKVLSIKGVYGKSGGKNFGNIWRTKRDIAGGGILLDQGIHMLDLCRYFCGDFTEFKSFVQNHFWNHDVEDNAFAIMKNERNQVAMIHSSATLWKHTFSMEIVLTEGYLKLQGILSGTMSYGRESLIIGYRQFEDEVKALGNPREEMIYFDKDHSWREEIEDFAQCILEDRPVTMGTSEDALQAMKMVYSIYQADSVWAEKWSLAPVS